MLSGLHNPAVEQPSLGTAPVVTADEQRLSVCLVVVCLEVQNTRELEEAV